MNKKLIIIIAAVVLLGGGAAAFFLLSGKKHPEAKQEAKKEAKKEGEAKEEKKDEGADKKEGAKPEEKKEEAKEAKAPAPEVNKDELPSKDEKGSGEEEFSYKLDPIVANIFDKNSIHYLKLGVLVLASNAETVEELKSNKPKLQDKLLFILSDVSMREVLTAGGKSLVKEDIQDAFNKMLKKGKVNKVYFTDFTVQ